MTLSEEMDRLFTPVCDSCGKQETMTDCDQDGDGNITEYQCTNTECGESE